MIELNQFQARAVNAEGHCAVLACPGSGKTRVLSMRAARLLAENKTGRLCAVTFTRDAATELKSRILQLCGEREAQRLAVGTFHSIALSQIRRLKEFSNTKLMSDGERLGLLRRCHSQYKCDTPFEKVLSLVDRAKSKLGQPKFEDTGVEDIFNAYQSLLSTEGVMDFSDILLSVVNGIRDQSIKPLSVRWLLADEFQDVDDVQAQWVMEHGKTGIEVTIVGDDDQSLYSFRNALGYEGMQRVSKLLVSQEITLPINYRCAPNILAHAARVISNNKNRANKAIEAHRTSIGLIKTHQAADRFDEAELVVTAIKGSMERSWAVLARTNSLLEIVEAELLSNAIPYRLAGGKSVWDGMVGSTLIGLLKSIQSDNWTGMANALSMCGIKADLLNLEHDQKSCGQMLDKIREYIPAGDVKTSKLIDSARRGIDDWRKQMVDGNTALAIYAASNWFAQNLTKIDRGALLKKLAGIVAKLKGTLAQRLNTLTRLESNANSACCAVLSTLHSSKGLEFDCVWIIGAEDNNLPHPDSTEDEERRLFYVGMTRARDRLEISSSLEDGLPSRFLSEAELF
ncbi:MAG: ATP-dependent helicase [Gallionella sp.]